MPLLHLVKHVPSSIMKTQPPKALKPALQTKPTLSQKHPAVGGKKGQQKNVCVFVKGGRGVQVTNRN